MAAVQYYLVVFQVMMLLWSFNPLLTAEAQRMTKYSCQQSCGNIEIPYPFGMKPGCYLEESFRINCNSSQVPILSINGMDLEVKEISVFDSSITVSFPIGFANCNGTVRNNVVDLERSPFVFSSKRNYFIASGCDTLALMTQNQSTIGGCMSICDRNNDDSTDTMTSCSGINCCQTKIPSYLKIFNVTLQGLEDGKGSSRRDGQEYCRYAYLVDQSWIYSKMYDSYEGIVSYNNLTDMDYFPVVLEWGIDQRVFQSLVKNGSFYNGSYTANCEILHPPIISTNQSSTNESSIDQSSTVQCSCTPGFDGNPYLDGFCDVSMGYSYYHQNMRAKMAGLGIGVGFGALLLLIGLWWLWKVFKRRGNEKLKKKYFKRNGGLLLQEQLSSVEVNVEKIKMFPSRELDKATDHYNVNRMLGQGGQGTVYKGMLADGKIIAVKKSKILDEGKIRQFINEVVILSQINHRNVVKLLGCCLETEVPLLVYEFIPNGTLFQFLHEPNEEFPLTWEIRLQIATEVAGALSYLHSAASIPIFHRDIKSTNILLDEKYRAKVADFGASRSVTTDQTHVTTIVQGTFGYLDPEYFQSSQFTDKSDVYSFGVVLVELLTGQKAISFNRSEDKCRSLATYFMMSMEENRLFNILDHQVRIQGKKEDVMIVAFLAKRCLNLKGKERPTMKEVAMVLEGIEKSHGSTQRSPKDLVDHQQETEYERNEIVGAPWDLTTSTSTEYSALYISAPSSDSKPLLHTY